MRVAGDGRNAWRRVHRRDGGGHILARSNVLQTIDASEKNGVEFSVVYARGPGKNGGGGYYTMYSGSARSTPVGPITSDNMLIFHTHPNASTNASGYWFDTIRNVEVSSPSQAMIDSGTLVRRGDQGVLQRFIDAGSPQRSSVIIPGAKPNGVLPPPFRFDVNSYNLDYSWINGVPVPKNR